MQRKCGSKKQGLWLLVALVLLAFGTAQAAYAETLEDLKEQIKVLQKKIEALEKQQDAAQKERQEIKSNAVTKGKGSGKFNVYLPWADTKVLLGGFAKLDMVASDVSAGDNSDADLYFYPRAIPLESADASAVTRFGAKQSRLYLKTETPTRYGKFKTHIEGDFYGQGGNQVVSNSSSYRLRHAYGELGNLLAGQTWTTFMHIPALPETLDFGGAAGEIFVRQAQIRWTQPFEWGGILFALENAETWLNTSDGNGALTAADDDSIPDMIVRLHYRKSFGDFSLAALGRNLQVDNELGDASTFGGAVSLSGKVPAFGKDDVRFLFNYGNALGRYMYTNFADAALDTQHNEIDAVTQWGGYVAYRHFWLDNLRSSLVYSYGEADNDVALVGDQVNKKFQSAHVNLIWSPVSSVNIGGEYIWGYREIESGEDGDLNRFLFSVKYAF